MNTFKYVTYIRTTPEKLWDALRKPEFIKAYWFGYTQECAWTKGASWKMVRSNGEVTDSGEVVEIDPPRRLVLKWRNEFMPELKAEGWSQATYELEPAGEMMKLTVTHEIDNGPKFIGAVSGGWPMVLSSLKSYLETGKGMEDPRPVSKTA